MQGHPALAVPLRPGDFSPAQTAAAIDANAQRAQAHGRLHRPLHGPAKGDPPLQLIADVLGHQLGIDFGLANLDNIQMHVAAGHLRKGLAQFFDIRALFADHQAGAGGGDGYPRLLGRPFDDDAGDAGLMQTLLQKTADSDVFVQQRAVFAVVGVPTAVPGPVDADPQADRIYFLTHFSWPPRAHAPRCVSR